MSNNYSTTLNGGSLQFHPVNPGYRQPSYQQAQYSSITPTQASGPNPNQYANAYSFTANTQGPLANGHSIPPSTVPSFEQLRNDSLPLPLASTQTFPNSKSELPLPRYNQNTVHPLPSKPLTLSALTTNHNSEEAKRLIASSREDGELSDGEVTKQVNHRPPSLPTTVSQSLHQSSTEAHRYSSLSQDRTYSMSATRLSKEHPTSNFSESKDIDQRYSEQSSRARARTALQDLFSLDIEYVQLVEEGLNRQLLLELCSEIGVQVTNLPVQDHISEALGGQRSKSRPIYPVKDKTIDSIPAMSQSTLQSNHSETSPSQPADTSTMEGKTSNSSALKTDSKDSSVTQDPKAQVLPGPIPDPSSAANSGLVKSPALSVLGKTLAVKPGEKGIERKEYIARMLAAKNSKLVPSAPPSLPPSNSAGLAVPPAVPQLPVSADTNPANISARPIPHKQITPESLPQRITDLSEKKKAQTDLARQRMEALNRSSSNALVKNRAPSNTSASDIKQRQGGVLIHTLVTSQPKQPPADQAFPPSESSQPLSKGVVSSTPQVSSYAPISRVPSFASPIPGLFMGHSQPLPPEFSVTFPAQPSKPTSQPIPQLSANQNIKPYAQTISNCSSFSTGVQPSGDAALVTNYYLSRESRKRQKAADFLDPPSVRIKRPLGQSEDTQVIIEISEDEEMDLSDEDRDHTNGCSSRVSADIRSENTNGSKQKAIRDLPPLTNFPYHKKSLTKSAVSTPPSVRTPMTVNGRDLMTEIQNLHQKIAEAERKKNFGPVASSTQTPGTPRFTASARETEEPPSSMTGIPNGLKEPSEQRKYSITIAAPAHDSVEEPISRNRDAAEVSEVRHTAQMLSDGSPITNQSKHDSSANNTPIQAEAPDSAKRALIRVQKHNQNEELEELELERKRAARIASEERILKQQKRDEEHTRKEAVRAKAVEDAKQEQEFIERRRREERLAQIETERVQAVEAARQKQLLEEQQKREEELARIEAERKEALETAKNAERKQLSRRKVEIESGLPILDAEVERTKQRLQNLRKEIEVLEDEVLKGVEGRQILIEELNQIVQALSIAEDGKGPATGSMSDLSMMDNRAQPDNGSSRSALAAPQDTNGGFLPNETETPQPIPPPVSPSKETSSIDKLAGDLMDISDSDEDDGDDDSESTDRTQNSSTNKAATTVSDDDEEMYEPPTTFESQPQSGDLVDEEPPQTLVAIENSNQGELQQPLTNNQDVQVPDDTQAVASSPPIPDPLISTQLPRSPIDVDIVESDSDYEPPEPTLPVDVAESLTDDLANEEKTSSVTPETMQVAPTVIQPTEENTGSKVDQSPLQEATKVFKKPGRSYFTPYQSALKQFKSFRNHPDLVSEVPGGFRSLTYSHKIDPHIPLCQYEAAGGRCNDASCDSQHFRNMGLSDDLILVQLGSQPEGLDTAQNATYVAGLKQVIQDMREKKIKDFNVVSSKITAYRSKFLGDSTRILPL